MLKLFCVCWMCNDAALCYEIHFSQRLYKVIFCECHRNLSLILPLAKSKKNHFTVTEECNLKKMRFPGPQM